jgi:hypothetical protein
MLYIYIIYIYIFTVVVVVVGSPHDDGGGVTDGTGAEVCGLYATSAEATE